MSLAPYNQNMVPVHWKSNNCHSRAILSRVWVHNKVNVYNKYEWDTWNIVVCRPFKSLKRVQTDRQTDWHTDCSVEYQWKSLSRRLKSKCLYFAAHPTIPATWHRDCNHVVSSTLFQKIQTKYHDVNIIMLHGSNWRGHFLRSLVLHWILGTLLQRVYELKIEIS